MLPVIIEALGALGGGGGLSSMGGMAGNQSFVGQAEANALQQGMKHAGSYVESPMRVPQQQAPAQQQAPKQQGVMQAPPFYLASPATQQQVIGQWMNTQPQSIQQQWGMQNGF